MVRMSQKEYEAAKELRAKLDYTLPMKEKTEACETSVKNGIKEKIKRLIHLTLYIPYYKMLGLYFTWCRTGTTPRERCRPDKLTPYVRACYVVRELLSRI